MLDDDNDNYINNDDNYDDYNNMYGKGKIHMTQMKFGNSFFPVSLTILDQNDVDFLFGLDMLKRHRCEISLADNELRIDGGYT